MTLIEIAIVMVIMGIVMAVAVPSMKGMNEKNKMRSAAREFVALMKYARSEAIFGERMTEVFLDTDKRQFWLDLRTPDPKTGQYNPKAKKTQLELKRDLPKEVWFEEVSSYDDNIIKDKIIAVDFYPDGTASPTAFTLTNKGGARVTIEVLKATGLTEVSAGTIEEKKEKERLEREEALGEMSYGEGQML